MLMLAAMLELLLLNPSCVMLLSRYNFIKTGQLFRKIVCVQSAATAVPIPGREKDRMRRFKPGKETRNSIKSCAAPLSHAVLPSIPWNIMSASMLQHI